MKFYYAAITFLARLISVVAQGMDSLPACARECATGAIPKTCQPIDVGCICGTKSFISDMSCCVAKSCSPQDEKAALGFALQLCSGAGVTDLPSSASCANSATSTNATSASTTTSPVNSSGNSTASATITLTGTKTQSASGDTQPATPNKTNTASSPTATGGGVPLLPDADASIFAVVGMALVAVLA
ncbi:putative CFEM domain protein [Aspergillus violaceofuscus CBS 115571]|uniref:Putative CFEM domain protein n=1 Tax=Aspergillus violaceofuscus (strain CBS 115571) TaxID=1450538 RepID=A0A2V5IHG5_ASPV1|nr:putative CFEM domain protein [Aspergillus violaceofuscus CBS 115571]